MLEQLAYEIRVPQQRMPVFQVGDLEYLSASALYSPSGPRIRPSFGHTVIPLGNLDIPDLKDIHESFKTDRYGNPYGLHTTFISTTDKKKHVGH